ncbi:MAG: hypothetical protein E7425_09400 [Ruminococcaceae bacterium]|jgi:hypothetical protein|nr:hypothetical protein [Oscillospiraceae bacterium]
MFDYNICTQADKELFLKQCQAIEAHIKPLLKERVIHDIDGTLTQRYHHQLGQITVCNDEQVGALYVTSDFDLIPFFNTIEKSSAVLRNL